MTVKDFLHDERAARPSILALVLGAHVAVIVIAMLERYERARDQPAPSRLIMVPTDIDDRGRLTIPDAFPPGVMVQSPPSPSLAPTQLPADSTLAGPATAMPDWKQSGADAAADAARNNYRALGPRPEDPAVKMPPSPFKPPARHKFGDVDEDPLENPVIWLNENCYVRMEDPQGPEPGDPFAAVNRILCAFAAGKRKPRGDLFEHLRKPAPVP